MEKSETVEGLIKKSHILLGSMSMAEEQFNIRKKKRALVRSLAAETQGRRRKATTPGLNRLPLGQEPRPASGL